MQEDKVEEYARLRSEIDRNSQVTTTVFLASVTVTSALIGYGLGANLGPIFLSPFAIIIPSLFFITSQLESTTRISTYIIIFLEAASNEFNWETRWLELRQKGLLPNVRKYTLSVSGIYGALGTACIVLAGSFWDGEWWIFVAVIVPILSLTLFGVYSLRRAFSIGFIKQYLDAWSKLKQED